MMDFFQGEQWTDLGEMYLNTTLFESWVNLPNTLKYDETNTPLLNTVATRLSLLL